MSYKNMSLEDIKKFSMFGSPEKNRLRQKLFKLCQDAKSLCLLGGLYSRDPKLCINLPSRPTVVTIEERKDICDWVKNDLYGHYRGIFVVNSTFNRYIASRMREDGPFCLMFADYTCPWGIQVEKDISCLFKCPQKIGAVLAVTISKGRDGEKRIATTQCFQKICCGRYEYYKKDRIKVMTATIVSIAYRNGYTLKLIDSEEYQNSYIRKKEALKKGQKMMFMVFKIVGNFKKER